MKDSEKEKIINEELKKIGLDGVLEYVETQKNGREPDLYNVKRKVPVLDRELCHMIASGMFEGVFEVIRHDMPKEHAVVFVEQLREFYTAGWMKIMGQ